ncbi:hypothetical protein AMATHDRAFT_60944 [Amanita thiersii Skay4041]|uniref:Uncharacterized protein n=1 Tax=Amanita thiersii Skay4041 TaxID=703135 RepID=A0A2A9NS69_9AGAR|nr:hypothetical protein AMATHDRAFT_60944 [Amanita thiersii Skay4041]
MVQLIYDNAGPGMQTSGSWLLLGSSSEYNNTAYLTSQYGATMTFRFQGTFVAVYGTIEPSSYKPNSTNVVTTYTLDGAQQKNFNGSYVADSITSPVYHQLFFESASLEDGPHELVIKYEGAGQRFYLDYFLVTPSVLAPSKSNASTPKVEMIDDTDPRVGYSSSDWELGTIGNAYMNSTHRPSTIGSTATVSFVGSSITAFASVNASQGMADVTFSVDGATPQVPIPPVDFQSQYAILSRQPYYQSPRLKYGEHNLTIRARKVYPEFNLDFFLVESSAGQGASATSLPPSSSTIGAAGVTRAGVVAGSVIGALAFLVILSLALLFWLRRRRCNKPDSPVKSFISPYLPELAASSPSLRHARLADVRLTDGACSVCGSVSGDGSNIGVLVSERGERGRGGEPTEDVETSTLVPSRRTTTQTHASAISGHPSLMSHLSRSTMSGYSSHNSYSGLSHSRSLSHVHLGAGANLPLSLSISELNSVSSPLPEPLPPLPMIPISPALSAMTAGVGITRNIESCQSRAPSRSPSPYSSPPPPYRKG